MGWTYGWTESEKPFYLLSGRLRLEECFVLPSYCFFLKQKGASPRSTSQDWSVLLSPYHESILIGRTRRTMCPSTFEVLSGSDFMWRIRYSVSPSPSESEPIFR